MNEKSAQTCVNGCDAAPQPPSRVLCKTCLIELDVKFRGLLAEYERRFKAREALDKRR